LADFGFEPEASFTIGARGVADIRVAAYSAVQLAILLSDDPEEKQGADQHKD